VTQNEPVRLQVTVNPIIVAYHLRTYGEPAAADRLSELGEDEVDRIGEISARLAEADPKMPWARVVSIAAVEVVEGTRRDLRRRQRRFKDIPKPEADWFLRMQHSRPN
jgi:hypothetical protein